MSFSAKLLGERFNECRKKINISQEELAELIGKSVPMISYYGSGKRVPPPETLYKLCEILHVSSDYLLGLVDEPQGDISPELKEKISKLETLEAEVALLKTTLKSIRDLSTNVDL